MWVVNTLPAESNELDERTFVVDACGSTECARDRRVGAAEVLTGDIGTLDGDGRNLVAAPNVAR